MSNIKTSLMLLFISAMLAVSCGEKREVSLYVSFFKGDVKVKRSGGEEAAVSFKAKVKDGDIYRVGKKSLLVLTATDGLTVRVEPETEAVIKSVQDIEKREIFLNNGRILSSVNKLTKGGQYRIRTKTAVASVRGTQFITKYEEGRTSVAVARGLVSVKGQNGKSGEEMVAAGKTGLVEDTSDKVVIREHNRAEKLEVSKFDITPSVEKIENKKPEQLKEIFKDTFEKSGKIEKRLQSNKGLSFSEMKKRYGRVDIVTLYNGRVIRGVITSRGSVYRIVTTGGVVTVNSNEVRNTRAQR